MDSYGIRAGGERAGHLGLPLTSPLIFIEEETEALRREMTWPKSHSQLQNRLDSDLPSPVLLPLNPAYPLERILTCFVVVGLLNEFNFILWFLFIFF